MFMKLRSRTQADRAAGGDSHRDNQCQKVASQGNSRTYLVPKIAGAPSEKSTPCSLPLYRGKRFELLSAGELKDTMSYCIYCSQKFCSPSSRFSHLLGQHHQEHYKNIMIYHEEVRKAYEIGEPMNLTNMQQEAYIMATLEKALVQAGTSLDKIHNDVVFQKKKMTPLFFSMLFNLVKIRDDKYAQILRILCHAINILNQNSADIINKFFKSDQFFQLYMKTNMIIDEIWLLRKEYPEKLPEWKIKHRHILKFQSKLLKFLRYQFGLDWVQSLKEKSEEQRVRVWPLQAGAGD